MTYQVYGSGLSSDFNRFQERTEAEEGPERYEYDEPCPFCAIIDGDGSLKWEGQSEDDDPEGEAGRLIKCWQCGQTFETGFKMEQKQGTVLQWTGPNAGRHVPARPVARFTFKHDHGDPITDDQINRYLEQLPKRAKESNQTPLELLKDDFTQFACLALLNESIDK